MATVNESEDCSPETERANRLLRVELLAALMLDGRTDLEAIDVVYGHALMPGQNNRIVVWLPECQAREVVQAERCTRYKVAVWY